MILTGCALAFPFRSSFTTGNGNGNGGDQTVRPPDGPCGFKGSESFTQSFIAHADLVAESRPGHRTGGEGSNDAFRQQVLRADG